eukprot:952121-Amphidinium_carterae.1
MRLARTKKCDPALSTDESREWQGRQKPNMDVEIFNLNVDELWKQVPDYDTTNERLCWLAIQSLVPTGFECFAH